MDKCKYSENDYVVFDSGAGLQIGWIYIVDKNGTFDQHVEPSYDIMVEAYGMAANKMLFKHIRQSWIKRKVGVHFAE